MSMSNHHAPAEACASKKIGSAAAASVASARSCAAMMQAALFKRESSLSPRFIILVSLIFMVQNIAYPTYFRYDAPPCNLPPMHVVASVSPPQSTASVIQGTTAVQAATTAATAAATSTTTTTTTSTTTTTTTAQPPHNGRHDGNCTIVQWRVVITGNLGYEKDFLNWYHHCSNAGICPANPSQKQQLNPSLSSSCGNEPKFADVVLYAEDVALYEKYNSSKLITVKKGWDVGSKFNDTSITGDGRFGFSDKKKRFHQMMSRRPSILLKELELAQGDQRSAADNNGVKKEVNILFMDLDTVILKDPRPYFVGDYDFWAADAMNDWSGPYNAGMLAMKPTDISIDCVRRWRAFLEKQEKAKANQKTFNNIVRRMNTTIAHKMLSRGEFPVGKVLLEIGYDSLNEHTLEAGTVVLHNNYCEKECSKSDRLKRLGLWTDTNAVDLHIG
mmetsp:Transcript_310/g.686  ORF Transcript_310/g.686 Transcript_310/m.686 type:complete len:445 (-) Transcript_310:114-1448(-)